MNLKAILIVVGVGAVALAVQLSYRLQNSQLSGVSEKNADPATVIKEDLGNIVLPEDDGTEYNRQLTAINIENAKAIRQHLSFLESMNKEYASSLDNTDVPNSRAPLSIRDRFNAFLEISAVMEIYGDQLDTTASTDACNREIAGIEYRYRLPHGELEQIQREFEIEKHVARVRGHSDFESWEQFRLEQAKEKTENATREAEALARYLDAVPEERKRQADVRKDLDALALKQARDVADLSEKLKETNVQYFAELTRRGQLNEVRFGVTPERRREYFYRYVAIMEVHGTRPRYRRHKSTPVANSSTNRLISDLRSEYGLSKRQGIETEAEFYRGPDFKVRQRRIALEKE